MTVDTSGIDLQQVRVPISGWSAWAPKGSYIPTEAELGSPAYTLPVAYKRLGLRTPDGAPEWAEAPSTPLETFEDGHEVSAGTGAATVTQTFAQWDETAFQALRGVTLVGGAATIDVDAVVEGILFTAVLYRLADGTLQIERRVAPARVTGITTARDQRGAITGNTVTWSVKRSALLGQKHYRVAPFMPEDSAPDPVISAVLPAGQSVGEPVNILGAGFTGATAVTIDGLSVVAPVVVNDSLIIAIIPASAAGPAPVVVTTPNGVSPAGSYTVV